MSATFDQRIEDVTGGALRAGGLEVLQLNLGLLCNQSCAHCHVEASPRRTEIMGWPVLRTVLHTLPLLDVQRVELTGGAPEMNPHFRQLLDELHEIGVPIQVRTNLTVLLLPGMTDLPERYRELRVHLVASLPCYLEENVRAQRGGGTYESSIEAIRRLNALGYGRDPELRLDLVYNPGGPSLPPEQAGLEADYRRELGEAHGITFTRLLTITNMPLGRFLERLEQSGEDQEYVRLLERSFNPRTLDGLMCRRQISVAWDGTLHDCDFNLALSLPVDHGAPDHVSALTAPGLPRRRVVTGPHCFGCTAGSGSSCGGSLVQDES
jgi:radical SAM/Cys-rich protein